MPITDEPDAAWPLIRPTNYDEPADQTMWDACALAASTFLWIKTGYRFGLRQIVGARPCRTDYLQRFMGSGFFEGVTAGGFPNTPYMYRGAWYLASTCSGHMGQSCSCTATEDVTLPAGSPVHSVDQVKVDGDVLDASAYRLDNGRILTRIDGKTWPMCQDLSVALGEPGTWSVDYSIGIPVPQMGLLACGELATELYQVMTDQDSTLSARVQSLARQGVTHQLIDPSSVASIGKTGLMITDLWIAAVNPDAKQSGARVYSPDIPRGRRVV